MENFEKYIKDNQQKLEHEGPINPEIWLSIENKVLKQKNKRNRLHIKWITGIAATLLLAVMALYGGAFERNDPHQILAQYGIEDAQLVKQVNLKTKALARAKIPKDRKEDFDLLLTQLQFLDLQYKDYLQYIETNGYQPFIGEQIINYYKSKINLLDKIQQEIKKIDYYENKYQSNSPSVELNI